MIFEDFQDPAFKIFLVENEGKSVKKAVLAAESNIDEESISDENEELSHEGESSL